MEYHGVVHGSESYGVASSLDVWHLDREGYGVVADPRAPCVVVQTARYAYAALLGSGSIELVNIQNLLLSAIDAHGQVVPFLPIVEGWGEDDVDDGLG